MKVPVALVDTNVVVSALLTSRPESPTARILDAMLRGAFPFLLSRELLGEYRAVLLRPKIRERHGLTEEKIDAILTDVAANARFREPFGPRGSQRKGDAHLLDFLAIEPDAVFVTGDRPLGHRLAGRLVLSPRDFLKLIES